MHLKTHVDSANRTHVRFTVFSTLDGGTLANCGSLCMSPLEYINFTSALSFGQSRVVTLTVTHDDKIFNDYLEGQPC